jgi:hypothetical protein
MQNMYIHVIIDTLTLTFTEEVIMSTTANPDTDTTFASRWWKYFSNLEQAMDFDSQAHADLSLRQLRQTVTALETRVAELETGRASALEAEPLELTKSRAYHG